MPSWLIGATKAGARGLTEHALSRLFGPCIFCSHLRQPSASLPLGAPSAQLQPLVGWRRCVQNMHDPKGLNDARSASPPAPA